MRDIKATSGGSRPDEKSRPKSAHNISIIPKKSTVGECYGLTNTPHIESVEKGGEVSRIEPMWKTFLQRWWVINRLDQFCTEKGGIVWGNEEDFIRYLRDLITDKSQDPNPTYPIRFPYSWIGNIKDDLLLDVKIRNLIHVCSDKEIGYRLIISEHINKNDSGSGHALRLSSLGQERYSWTYIVFGTEAGKKIWTGILNGLVVGLLVWYATERFQKVVPPVIQIQYPTQK